LRKIRREVPRALEAVILKCLQKDPDRRFQTVAELAEALVRFGAPDARERAARVRRILDGSEIELRRVKPSRARPRRWLAGALVLAALAGVGVAVLQQQPEVARSSAVAARAWSSLASHLAQASAVAIRPVAPTPPAPDPSPAATPAPAAAIAPPSAPAGELGPTAAAAGPASPAANVTHGVSSPPPQVTAARSPSPLDSSSSASIAALLAEARGDAPSEPTAAKGSRARAMHHAWHKHYTAEPVPSPDPAPPIVAGPAAEPPARSAPTTTPTAPIPSPPDLPTPYDEPVPDLGSRD
jgi:serine/threonine-protein kinase